MAKTFNRMRIDVNEKPNSICINPVQNDTQSRYLDVSLYNNGLPIDLTGEVVRINFKKEGGTTFFNQGEITNAAEGRCQFALTNEVLSEAKTLKAQISIWSGEGEILSTRVFTIYVTESIRNDEEVESTNEFGVLVVLFQEIQNSLDLMQTIAENFGEPGEKAAEFEAETFWQMLEVLAQRADTKEIVENIAKIALNSTFDTSYLTPLDKLFSKLLAAKIVCRGTIGTKFTLTRTDGYYPETTAEITENSLALPNDLYAVIVPVPCGNYSIKIDVNGTIATATVNASAVGQHYTFSYSSYTKLATFTANGVFTVPDDVNKIFVDAAGGGGGGGGGYGGAGSPAGGGGGGGCREVIKREVSVTGGQEISITIGTGGTGGLGRVYRGDNPTDGNKGGSTLLGSLLTVEGGNGGRAASLNSGGSGGTSSGGRGGSAGSNGSNGAGGNDGKSGGLGGAGASASGNFSSHGGGGGGAGTIKGKGGNGGDAYNSTSDIGSGSKNGASGVGEGSGGGGGAGNSNDNGGGNGGDGKSGFLDIYKGVQVI